MAVKDENVFDIMQGVCISVFVKMDKKSPPLRVGQPKVPCCAEGKLSQVPLLAEGVGGG